jgi:putative membrane protein
VNGVMWWPDGWGWGGWVAMTLAMLAMWGFVAWLIVALIRPPESRHERNPNAEEILAERFARGEIDEEEFTKRKALLRSRP